MLDAQMHATVRYLPSVSTERMLRFSHLDPAVALLRGFREFDMAGVASLRSILEFEVAGNIPNCATAPSAADRTIC